MRQMPLLVLCVLLTSMCAVAADVDEMAPQREEFKLAWSLAEKGDARDLAPHLQALKDYPLRPYLDFAYLDATLDTASDADVEQFLAVNPDLPVVDTLRQDWLVALARRQEWPKILAYYRDEIRHCAARR
jgi:soluble lytic murein transglycosylase